MWVQSPNAHRYFPGSHQVDSSEFEEISTDCYSPDNVGHYGIATQISHNGNHDSGILIATCLK